MKKEFLNPTISLLAYVEEDILTTSEIHATQKPLTGDENSVNVKMSQIIELN